jgi:hypothetical protein
MESGIHHLTVVTGSTAGTLFSKVKELVAGAGHKQKIEILEAKVNTLEKDLAKERQDNQLLEKQLEHAQSVFVLSKDIHTKLDTYLGRVDEVCSRKANLLVEGELQERYLSKISSAVDLGMVVKILVDFTEKVKDIQEDIQTTAEQLMEWDALNQENQPPSPRAPVIHDHGVYLETRNKDTRTMEEEEAESFLNRYDITGRRTGLSPNRVITEVGEPSSTPQKKPRSSNPSPTKVGGSPKVVTSS